MENKLSFQSLGSIIWNRKVPIAILTFIVGAVVFSVNYFVLPKTYKAKSTVMFQASASIPDTFKIQSIESFMASSLMEGSALNLVAIMESDNISSKVFSRDKIFNQYQEFARYSGVDKEELALSEKDFLRVYVHEKILYVFFTAPSAKLAADVANAYVEELLQFVEFQRQNINSDQFAFVENELPKSLARLEKAEELIRDFQEQNPEITSMDGDRELFKRYSALHTEKERLIVELSALNRDALTGQTFAEISQSANEFNELMNQDPAIMQIKSKLLEYQMEYEEKSQILSASHPTIVNLQNQIEAARNELKAQLAKYYSGKKKNLSNIELLMEAYDNVISELPDQKLEYTRLERDREIMNQVYTLLKKENERLRIDRLRRDYSLSVLDHARPPRKKNSPATVKNTLVFSAAFFFLISYIFIVIDVKKFKKETPEPTAQA